MKLDIKRKVVNSSNIKSVGFNKEGRVLEVEFYGRSNAPNKVYRYWPVTESAYEEMIKADSIGNWFWNKIRTNDKITCKPMP